jgi:hypothetical protein
MTDVHAPSLEQAAEQATLKSIQTLRAGSGKDILHANGMTRLEGMGGNDEFFQNGGRGTYFDGGIGTNTGPVFMLQVYDRVLGSRSEETLLVLVALMTGLYLAYGILDHVRGRLLARAGDRLSAELEPVVFEASIRRQAQKKTQTAMRDLEAVRGGLPSRITAASRSGRATGGAGSP